MAQDSRKSNGMKSFSTHKGGALFRSQRWRFVRNNLFSRLAVPFSGLLFAVLRERALLACRCAGSGFESWAALSLALVFFFFMQVSVLKKEGQRFHRADVWTLGLVWAFLFLGLFILLLNLRGDTAGFRSLGRDGQLAMVVLSLIFSPRLAALRARGWSF